MKHKFSAILKYIFVVSLTILFFSCQPMLKLYLGIKDFETYIDNEERLEYYEPVLEGDYDLSIYSIKDSVGLDKVFDTINDYPQIYVNDLKDTIVYRLSCYADVDYVMGQIQDKSYRWYVDKAEVIKQYNFTTELLKENTVLSFQKNRNVTVSKDSLRYDILFISAPFLGKKLRRKSMPVFDMNNINSVEVVDLSVDTTLVAKH